MSGLAQTVEDYLSVRRSLGFKLEIHGRLLADFVAHLDHAGLQSITTDAALTWATKPKTATSIWWTQRLGVVRGFARYLQALDPNTEVPPADLLVGRRQRGEPHLYSDEEVAALMAEARALPSPLKAATYETVIGLVAVAGLRPGEAIRLDRDDIDWGDGLLKVVWTKFGKCRDLPLHPSTIEALGRYARLRDHHFPDPRSASFFVSLAGTRLIHNNVDENFRKLLSQAGIGSPSRRRPPRLHDLRHSYAVKTVIGFYRAGLDVEAQLPLLSTYLGHRNPSHTYWYLSAAPELLSLAASRRENKKDDRS